MRSLIGAGQTGMNSEDGVFQLGDERILGDGDFVAEILAQGEAKLTANKSYRAAGFGLDELARVVATVLKIDPAEVRESVVSGLSFCYFRLSRCSLRDR